MSLELNGNVQTPAIQGTFDVNTVFNLTAGLKWSFAKDKATVSARCSDIFETGMPNIKIRFKGQHLDMDNAFLFTGIYSTFLLSLWWIYKERK